MEKNACLNEFFSLDVYICTLPGTTCGVQQLFFFDQKVFAKMKKFEHNHNTLFSFHRPRQALQTFVRYRWLVLNSGVTAVFFQLFTQVTCVSGVGVGSHIVLLVNAKPIIS